MSIPWTAEHTGKRSTWTSGPVEISATRNGVCLWLRVNNGQTYIIKSLEDLSRVTGTIRDRVRTAAGDAIVTTLLEAFGRHQELALQHALLGRTAEGVRA
ncbi:MAG TPA: hypothetical protein PK095_00090 [Myxococcota bacterium]|nr:hypothetical protein [Myxococcota bacterium]